MKVLVTGGAGFIGSHLCERLVDLGFQVRCLDNLWSGNMQNLSKILKNPNFEFVKGDIMDFKSVLNATKDVDVIYHLGAVVGVKHYVEHPLKVIEVNVYGTHNVLDAARRNDVEKVIFSSTSEVYGKNVAVPLSEDSDRIFGSSKIDRWCYGIAKGLDEHLCIAYHREYGVRTIILRYFNVYGPRQECSEYGGVIAMFIRRVLKDQPPQVFGDGTQTRAFTYVDDIVDGTLLAAEKDFKDPQIFNLGSENEISILDLAKLIIRLAGKEDRLKPVFVPYEEFYGPFYEDTPRRVPDITRAKEILGYRPKIGLDEGLRRTIEWYRAYLKV